MEKPKTDILFAQTPNGKANVLYVSLCSLHLEHPSDTTRQALEYSQQLTLSQRLLMLLSGLFVAKGMRVSFQYKQRNEAGIKTEPGSRQPSRMPAWLLNSPCKTAHRCYHPAINFSRITS